MILRVLFICVGVGACVPWRSFWFQPKPSITDDPAIPDDPATAEPPALEVVLAKTDLVLMPGESWPVGMSLTPSGGVTGPYTISCDGMPPQTSCALDADAVVLTAGSGATSSAAAPITITVHNNDTAAATSLRFGVAAGPRLQLSPSSLVLPRDQSAPLAITLQRTAGVDEAIGCTWATSNADLSLTEVVFAASATSAQATVTASGTDTTSLLASAELHCALGQASLAFTLQPRSGTVAATWPLTGYTGGTNTVVSDMAIQDDGSVVLVGTAVYNSKNLAFAARTNASGALDPTFSLNAVGAPLQPGYAIPVSPALVTSSFTSVAIDSTGRIVACGTLVSGPSLTQQDILVVRLTKTGALDTSFNSSGSRLFHLGSDPTWPAKCDRVLTNPDNSLTLAVTTAESNVTATYQATAVVVTLDANGANPTSLFSPIRLAPPATDALDRLQSTLHFGVDASGRYLFTSKIGGGTATYLSRLNANGSLDSTFAPLGTLSFANSILWAVTSSPTAVWFAGTTIGLNSDIIVGRVANDGSAGFTASPVRTFDFFGLSDDANAALLQQERLLVAGSACRSMSEGSAPMLLRVLSDGTLDLAFGDASTAGRKLLPSAGKYFRAAALKTHANGLVYLAGTTNNSAYCVGAITDNYPIVFKVWP